MHNKDLLASISAKSKSCSNYNKQLNHKIYNMPAVMILQYVG